MGSLELDVKGGQVGKDIHGHGHGLFEDRGELDVLGADSDEPDHSLQGVTDDIGEKGQQGGQEAARGQRAPQDDHSTEHHQGEKAHESGQEHGCPGKGLKEPGSVQRVAHPDRQAGGQGEGGDHGQGQQDKPPELAQNVLAPGDGPGEDGVDGLTLDVLAQQGHGQKERHHEAAKADGREAEIKDDFGDVPHEEPADQGGGEHDQQGEDDRPIEDPVAKTLLEGDQTDVETLSSVCIHG